MNELKPAYRVTVIIITVQILVILLLAIAAWFDVFKFEPTFSSSTGSTITALWTAVIFLAVGSFLLRRSFFNWEKLADTMLLKGKPGLIGKLRFNALILSSIALVIAVLGLAITSVSADSSQMLRAAAIALIVSIINFPRFGVWEKIVGNLEQLDSQR